ncbi:hypothetical protein TMatcc_007334 [Talaromyces marneffei ATCC 18224]
MGGNKETQNWRCAAMVKDPKNADRIKVICRHEEEIQQVKEVAQKIDIPGIRVLRDQLYPVKIDNANRTAVLDADGNILPGAAEVLGKENNQENLRTLKSLNHGWDRFNASTVRRWGIKPILIKRPRPALNM